MLRLFLLTLVTFAICTDINIDTTTGLFIDSFHRYRIFHGVNTVYKTHPFHPQLQGFNSNFSLSIIDLANLKSFGMNVIRLHVAWQGVQPKRNQYNYTYLNTLKTIIENCNQYNIKVILDSHQDLFSRKFCGEGFPDWVVARTDFPSPLRVNMSFDEEGYPKLEDCLKTEFGLFYTTFDVMRFQEDFFKNVGKNADKFAQMWGIVAKYMAGQPNLLGYEILNEPVGGNMWRSLSDTIFPGRGNNKILLPFYKNVYQEIRKYDKDSLIFFQPASCDIFSGGFVETPGGQNELHKQVFSYHVYCPTVTKQGQPTSNTVCRYFDKLELQSKVINAKNLKIGMILSEFGALSNSDKSASEIIRLTGDAENNFNSWVYWQFKYYNDITTAARPGTTESFYNIDGSLQTNKVKALSHPYVYAICGTPLTHKWHSSTSSLVFTFVPSFCSDKHTELYLNELFYYQLGFNYTTTPTCNDCKLEKISHGYYQFVVPQKYQSKNRSKKMKLTIHPK